MKFDRDKEIIERLKISNLTPLDRAYIVESFKERTKLFGELRDNLYSEETDRYLYEQ